MSRVGLFCFLGRGHLDPALALGRGLAARGHTATVFHLTIAEGAVRAAGLQFQAIDRDEPFMPTPQRPRRLRALETAAAVHRHAERVLREGPGAVTAAGLDGLVVDQMDLGAGTVAEHLDLPFVTFCAAPPMLLDRDVPPPFFGWSHRAGRLARLRNQAGNYLVGRVAAPVLRTVNRQRGLWGLAPLRGINDSFSRSAIVTQVPRSFDFPGAAAQIVHAGPLRSDAPSRVKFPWSRLDGRPLVFASMGTIRNDSPAVFRTLAAACAGPEVQLVLSLGAGPVSVEALGALPGDPIVVPFAPQRELIRRARVVINCAGLNTTLDALASGVPIVAIPVGEDQPGVAARIRRSGAGVAVPFRRLSEDAVREAVRKVDTDPRFRAAARRLQRTMAGVDAVGDTVTLVERALALRPDCEAAPLALAGECA
jgi:zeaxanthin glucosyltransferase